MTDRRRLWVLLVVTWVLSVGYAAASLTRGWLPHDEGTLGQSADRVLAGQLPHRDYDEIYTGGLALADAVALRVFGDNLVSPRLVLLLVFALWVPAMFYVASRFLGPLGAGGVTLAAAAWSIPNYSAAMPSWFNLFFAGLGLAALIRHTEVGSAKWIFWAGVCGGLSCLCKIIGLYYIAGALLFLVYQAQGPGPRWFRMLIGAALILFVVALLGLTHGRWDAGDLSFFVIPSAVLVALLLAAPVRVELIRRIAWLAAGVLLPIVLFLLPYVFTHGLPAIAFDVFMAPTRRLTFAAMRAPGLNTASNALLLLGPAALAWWRPSWRKGIGIVVIVLLTTVCVLGSKGNYYRMAWNTLQWLVPLAVAVGAVILWRSERTGVKSQQLFALLAVTAGVALVQFPYSSPIYLLYAAPLGILAMAAVVASVPGGGLGTWFSGAWLAFAVAFPVRWVRPGFIYDLGIHFTPVTMTSRLPGRGALRVSAADSAEYGGLMGLVGAHTRGGAVYATPDCPEVNFLTDTRNPTRTLYDFLDDPVGRTPRILGQLDSAQVTVVVLNSRPGFSGPVPTDLAAALAVRYPHAESVGRFEVRWRE